MDSKTIKINQDDMFSGNRLDFPTWKSKMISKASNASPLQALGVLGFMLSDAEYAANHAAFPLLPLNDPGTFAAWNVLPGNQIDANNPAAFRYSQFSDHRKDHRELQLANNLMHSYLFEHLDSITKAAIADPITGTSHLSLEELFTAICNIHGSLKRGDFAMLKRELETIFDPATTNMQAHISVHERAHSIYASAAVNQPLSEISKTQFFMDSFNQVPHYEQHVQLWLHRTPILPLVAGGPSQTFASLKTEIFNFDLDLKCFIASPTAGQISNLANAATQQKGRGKKTKVGVAGGGKAQDSYCWTHGVCKHTSEACTRQAAGHNPAATLATPLGGRQGRWADTKYA
jgi:hypothetical protein